MKIDEEIDEIRKQLELIIQLLQAKPTPWMTTREAAVFLRCSPSKVEEMTTIQYPGINSSQGLVWFHNYTGGRWVWRHGGGDAGVSTLASCCFEENSAVVVLTNGGSHIATGLITTLLFDFAAGLPSRGDVNGDGVIDVADVLYLINYLFKNGLAPRPLQAGDVNCDGRVSISDVVFLVNYLYKNGPPPC